MDDKLLSAKTAALVSLRAEIDSRKAMLKILNSNYESLSLEVMRMLEAMDIDSIRMHGFTFYTANQESVTLPKTEEDKQKLFEFLKAQDLYDAYITINSASLNSLYRALAEEALQCGVLEFRIPGIEPPTSFKQLRLKKT